MTVTTDYCPFAGGVWPQDWYASINEAIGDARKKMHAAQVDGNRAGVEKASKELDDLMAFRQRFRFQMSCFVGMALRIASEECGGLIQFAVKPA
jgi:hypothetical protein